MTNAEKQLYRAPCGGWSHALTPKLGGCWNNWNHNEVSVSLWDNTTQTINYTNPAEPALIDPYRMPNAPGYYPNCQVEPECGDGVNGLEYCRTTHFTNSYSPILGTGSVRIGMGHLHNWLTQSGSASVADCTKVGFKNVQARKIWHGKIAYNSRAYGVGDYVKVDWDYGACKCGWHGEDEDPITTKYRTVSGYGYAHYTFDDGVNPPTDYTAEVENTASIDRYSGVVTYNCWSASNEPDPSVWHGIMDEAKRALAIGDGHIGDIGSLLCDPTSGYIVSFGAPTNTTTHSPNSFTWEWWGDVEFCVDYPDCTETEIRNVLLRSLSVDFAGSITFTTYTKIANVWSVMWTYTITYTATGFSYTATGNEICPSAYGGWDISAHGGLSDPYTSAMLQSDINDLLDTWNMTNDVIYPWRTDTNINGAPLVTRDEYNGTPSLGLGGCGPDQNADIYSGQILGAPVTNGIVAYPGMFDWRFEKWDHCTDTETFEDIWYIRYYGDYARNSEGIPYNATQWTNYYDSHVRQDLPSRAYLYYDAEAYMLYAQKWAETMLPLQSYNYARPCGITDRTQIATNQHWCVSARTDNTLTAIGHGLETNDTASFKGYTPLNGIWAVTKNSADTVTLTTLLASGSWFPDYITTSEPIIGKLRWQNGTCPNLCGRVAITETFTGSTPVTLSLERACYLWTGDSIYITQSLDNSEYTDQTWKVIWIDSASIALQDSSPSPEEMGFNGYIMSTPTTKWQLNDVGMKGDYAYKEWHHDYRDVAESDRLWAQYLYISASYPDDGCYNPVPSAPLRYSQSVHGMTRTITEASCTNYCLPSNHCHPPVMCIAPSGSVDNFRSGRKHEFPTFTADIQYDCLWNASVESMMYDMLHQVPPCSCEYDEDLDIYECKKAMVEDPYGCTADTVTEQKYPRRDIFEMRCSPPTSPVEATLPSGIYMGCLTQEACDVFEMPQGVICNSPSDVQPWIEYSLRSECICGGGRWRYEYEANGIGCITPEVDI